MGEASNIDVFQSKYSLFPPGSKSYRLEPIQRISVIKYGIKSLRFKTDLYETIKYIHESKP